MLKGISDRRIRDKIIKRIDSLAEDPDLQGKPLVGELMDYHSVRAAGQRYRIIYRIEEETVIVMVVTLGNRRERSKTDVYSLAKKLLKLGLIERSEKKPKKPEAKKAKLRGKKKSAKDCLSFKPRPPLELHLHYDVVEARPPLREAEVLLNRPKPNKTVLTISKLPEMKTSSEGA